ncbi:MAG: hypothetical protein JNK37_09235 [Verrucomicrobiales bacterium]|nr:hypothetical protein [Verrucomicrobiales bacterium]
MDQPPALPDEPTSPPPPLPVGHPARGSGSRFRPGLFFGFLFGPPLLTAVGILLLGSDMGLAAAMIIAIGGSLVAGIVCAIHFASCQSSLSTGGRVGVGIALFFGCAAVSFALSFGGCLLGAGLSDAFRH